MFFKIKIKIFVVFIFVLEIVSEDVGFGSEGIDIWSIKKQDLGKNFFYEKSKLDNKSSYDQINEFDNFFYERKNGEELMSLGDLSLILYRRIGREASRRFFYELKDKEGFNVYNIKNIIEHYDLMFGENNTNKLLSYSDAGFYMDDYRAVVLFFNGVKNFYIYYGGNNYKIPLDKIREIVFNNFYWIVFNNSKRFSSSELGLAHAGAKDFIYKIDLLGTQKTLIKDFLESLDTKEFFYFLDLRSVEFSYLIDQIKLIVKDPKEFSLILENLNWERVYNIFYKIRVLGIYFNVYEQNPYTGHSQLAISNWDEKVRVGFKKETVSYWSDLFLGTKDKTYNSRAFGDVIVEEVKSYVDEEYKKIKTSKIEAIKTMCLEFFKYL